MKARFLSLCLLFAVNYTLIQAQNPRNWNVGISEGFSGMHYTFFPSLDFRFQGTELRISPIFPVFSAGLSQDLMPIASENEEASSFLFASFVWTHTNDRWRIRALKDNFWWIPVEQLSLMAGIRFHFLRRGHARIQVGTAYQYRRQTGNLEVENGGSSRLKATGELSVGVYLWPNGGPHE